VRVYYDTGVFIDHLSTRGNRILRTAGRRGRSPSTIAADAERLIETVKGAHVGGTCCLAYYEAEEALYKLLAPSAKGIARADTILVPAARVIPAALQVVIEEFEIAVLDLTSETIRFYLKNLDLRALGVRAADALHVTSAITFDADLIVSTDGGMLKLDGVFSNKRGDKIRCCDTDIASIVISSASGGP
jgi:hypothetical protein